MRRMIVLASLVALVVTACKIETNFGAVINADGSGTLIAEIGMDEEAQSFFMEGVDDPFAEQELANAPGARKREETRGDMTFWIVELDVDDITEAQDEILGQENSLLETFSITVTDERVTVSGSATGEDTFGGEGGETFDPAMLEESVSANVRITMPGSITSHNATSQEGNTLVWKVPVTGGALNIQAESDPRGSPASGGLPMGLILGIAAVALAGGAFFFLRKKNTDGSGDVTPAGMGEAPTPDAPAADE